MALFEMRFHSDSLKTSVSVNVIIPENAKTLIGMTSDGAAKFKTLYLLHGLSDDHSIWLRRTSIERYAADFGIAVVMPCVGRSWYTDTAYGAKYFTFVSEELPTACRRFFRGMSDRPEDNMIAGLSMGGYGAIKTALSCPDKFAYCASLSGALDIADFMHNLPWNEVKGNFGFEIKGTDELTGTKHDVYHLARRYKEEGHIFPKMYIWCGTEDGLLPSNRKFSELLTQLGVEHKYKESEGNHSWKYWDMHIQSALHFLLDE